MTFEAEHVSLERRSARRPNPLYKSTIQTLAPEPVLFSSAKRSRHNSLPFSVGRERCALRKVKRNEGRKRKRERERERGKTYKKKQTKRKKGKKKRKVHKTKRKRKKEQRKGKSSAYKLSRPRYKEISFTRTLFCILAGPEDKSRITFHREKATRSIL